jgi:hypothetical protein
LLASIPVLLFFWPFTIYMVVIVPLVIAPLLVAYLVIIKRSPHFGQRLPAMVILAVLVLAPTPRSFYGTQPIRHLVEFFESTNDGSTPLRLLGQSTITVCPYLAVAGRECEGDKWDDEHGARTLSSFTDAKDYDYLVYDTEMNYVRLQPSGMQEVLAGQNPQWHQVAEIGDYRVFRRIVTP